MKKIALVSLFVSFLCRVSFAQDVKIKKNIVYVNGQEEAQLEENPKNYFTLKSLADDKDLVFLKLVDPSVDATPQFNDNYFVLLFPDHDDEVQYKDFRILYAIKFLYQNKVIQDGKINIENLNDFVETYKTRN